MKSTLTAFILIFTSIILTACGGGGGGGETTSLPKDPGGGLNTTGSISLRWDTPSTKVDGNALSLSEINGYKIYLTTNSSNYPSQAFVDITDSMTTNYTLTNISTGKYYVYVTTYDVNGDESPFSDPISTTIL